MKNNIKFKPAKYTIKCKCGEKEEVILSRKSSNPRKLCRRCVCRENSKRVLLHNKIKSEGKKNK